ncbi:hypothetical protein BDK51DRAFT_37823 [Blyttiomyces helicus]|uniref:Uncharacterized protein n=1 Tax=Blyttiomyces helicus TaxID=388810 RepID=A0A4P9VXU8_9FUNG|nr:hypothetical protein BDK51DRAFT_37823 [Blyttiomyces helicus]|eukprot:RKO83765.1 hypothetical protein BDK51DRAFT_37823 [Blyttiomyces helicus]
MLFDRLLEDDRDDEFERNWVNDTDVDDLVGDRFEQLRLQASSISVSVALAAGFPAGAAFVACGARTTADKGLTPCFVPAREGPRFPDQMVMGDTKLDDEVAEKGIGSRGLVAGFDRRVVSGRVHGALIWLIGKEFGQLEQGFEGTRDEGESGWIHFGDDAWDGDVIHMTAYGVKPCKQLLGSTPQPASPYRTPLVPSSSRSIVVP